MESVKTKNKIVKSFILDVDGVFTTGQFFYNENGKFAKIFGAHDNDGIKLVKKFLNIQAISADKRGFNITKKRIQEDMRIPLKLVMEEERLEWLKNNFNLKTCIYMGDGIFDAKIFPLVAYAIAPQNAFFLTKKKAGYVTKHKSGEGAVAEACIHILKKFFNQKF